MFEIEVIGIGTEYLDRDHAVQRRFAAAIHNAEAAAPHRLGIVVALCLELGGNS
jgi:hypothetical protein